MIKPRIRVLIVIVSLLTSCSTYTTPRYSISADTNVALKSLRAANIGVGTFSGPAQFDATCRAVGSLAPPDGMPHSQYIKKALEDELKVVGVYAADNPRVILSGVVNKLAFSSSRGLTGGSWDIDLTLTSSNGSTLSTAKHYEFQSGFAGETACKQTAEAFMPAVQDLIGKVVRASEFKQMVQ